MLTSFIKLNEQNRIKVPIVIFFSLVFISISLVNHFLFRTYSLDLGLYNQALFDYAHGRYNFSTLLEPDFVHRNQLGDHFDLMLILLSPLYLIGGTYTLLLVQIAAIIAGGIGMAKSIATLTERKQLPVLAMIHFYSIWGVYSALAFDYHSNVLAAMLMPWLFLNLQQKKWVKAIVFFVLILICKENMALWAFFIASGLAIFYRKDKALWQFCCLLSLLALGYFIIIMKYAMPMFLTKDQTYIHFDYSSLGKTPMACLQTIFTRPWFVFSLFFNSQFATPETHRIKLELYQFVLFSGGFALLLRPAFLWIALPILAQKVLNDDYTKWGINHQYSIEFVPIICISLFVWLAKIKSDRTVPLAAFIVLITMMLTVKGMFKRQSIWYNAQNENIFLSKHYERGFNVLEVYKTLNQLPQNCSISASCTLTPHLAFRQEIYQFPNIANAQFIALLDEPESYYPIRADEFKTQFNQLILNSNYSLRVQQAPFYLFVRKDVSFANLNE